jgi:hypothetical protein
MSHPDRPHSTDPALTPLTLTPLLANAGKPEIAVTSGKVGSNYELSYLPGQRLSRCTCPNDDTHPGPKNPDGSWVGRSAPEIDMFEGKVGTQSAMRPVRTCELSVLSCHRSTPKPALVRYR